MIFEDENALAEHFKLTMGDIRELLGKGFWSIASDPADPDFEVIEVSPEQARRLRRFSQGRARQRATTEAAKRAAEAAKRKESDIERRTSERRRGQVEAMYRHGPIRRARPE